MEYKKNLKLVKFWNDFAGIGNIGKKRNLWKKGNSRKVWNIGKIGIKGKIRDYSETRK